MHLYIDEKGNSYNIVLKIKNNILYAIWNGREEEVNFDEVEIIIKEK